MNEQLSNCNTNEINVIKKFLKFIEEKGFRIVKDGDDLDFYESYDAETGEVNRIYHDAVLDDEYLINEFTRNLNNDTSTIG